MFGIFLCMSGGMLLVAVVNPQGSEAPSALRRFIGFAVGMVSFQGAALILTTAFLRNQEFTWREFLGLDSDRLGTALRLGLMSGLVAVPAAWLINQLSAWAMQSVMLHPEAQETIKVLERSVGWYQRLGFGVMAILLAPVVEEVLFRGIFFAAAKESGYPLLGLWGTSLIFAAIHGNLVTFVPLLLLSIWLTVLYDRTRVLLAPICTHAVFNLLNFVMFLLESRLVTPLPTTP